MYEHFSQFFMYKQYLHRAKKNYQDLRSTAIYGAKNYHFSDIVTIHSAVA